MKIKNKIILVARTAFAIALFFIGLSILNSSNSVFAATNWGSSTIRKALEEDLYQCAVKNQFSADDIKIEDFSYSSSPYNDVSGSINENTRVNIPVGLVGGDGFNFDDLTCRTLVYGAKSNGSMASSTDKMGNTEAFEGVIPLAWGHIASGGTDNSDIVPTETNSAKEDVAKLLVSMGYTYDPATPSSGKCIKWTMTYLTNGNSVEKTVTLAKACFTVGDNGKIQSEDFEIEEIDYNGDDKIAKNYVTLSQGPGGTGLAVVVEDSQTTIKCKKEGSTDCTFMKAISGETIDSIGDYVIGVIEKVKGNKSYCTEENLKDCFEAGMSNGYAFVKSIDAVPYDAESDPAEAYLTNADFYPDSTESAKIFIRNLERGTMIDISDYSKKKTGTYYDYLYSDLAFKDNEELTLYQGYLMNYYDVSPECYDDSSSTGTGKKVRLYIDGAINTNCYVESAKDGDKVMGLDPDTKHFTLMVTFDEIIEALNKNTADSPENEEIAAGNAKLDDDVDSDTSSTDAEETACQKGASNLGWIVCPIIQALSDAAGNLYEDVVSPALNMESELTNNDSVKSAWSTFRNIANTAFVILLLVVILSQVTGLGISNYGIKKILPKIIVTALLVNFSFIICQICLDASNIVGVNIRHLFESLETEVGSSITTTISSGESSTFNIDAGLVVGIAGGLGGLAAILIAGWVILIPVLITLITTVVSLLFAFVLLYVRKAIIILLVTISPLAFVCYALPNTKKLFDKWLKAMEGMVLLYPICGALIGAGDYAGHLLLSASSASNADSLIVLAALLVTVVPFFLVPSLLRGSFKALGSIGAAIGGFGLKTSKGIGGAAGKRLNTAFDRSKKAHRIADRRAEKDRKADARYNRHVIKAYGDKTDLSEAQQLRLAKAQKGDIANYNALKEAEAFGSTDFAKAAKMEAEQKAREARIGTISTKYTNLGKNDQFTQALTQAMANGDEETFTALYRLGSSKGFDVQIHDALSSDTASTYFNDTTNGANRRTYFYNEAEKGNSVTQKWYAKAARKAEQTGGSLSYMEYMKGSFDPNSSTNGSSFAKDVYDRGENSLVGQSEDTLQAITKSGAADQLSNACFDDTMIKMVTDPRADGKTLTAAEGLLSKRGGITTADAVNQQQLSKIRRASTLDAITSNGQNMAAVQKSVDAFKNPTTDATRRHVQSTNSNTMGWVRNH